MWNVFNIQLSCFITFFKADVYSFGLLLLEMCIRQFPVPDQIPDQIKLVPYPELKDLIVRCVQQVPERRASMEEVIQFLTRLTE